LLALLKVFLVNAQSIKAVGFALHDDMHFVIQAKNILEGRWLGPYDEMTLMRGPFYPIWIAFSHTLKTPLLISEHALYIFACIVAYVAIKPVVKNNLFRFFVFLILLFNPVSFDSSVSLRVIRSAIYPAVTLLVVSSFFGLATRALNKKGRYLIAWATLAGISLGTFYLTREESVWLLPYFLFLYLYLIIKIIIPKKTDLSLSVSLLAYPFVICLFIVYLVAQINSVKYGRYIITEIKSSAFNSAYGFLSRVYQPRERYVPVTAYALEAVYKISPSMVKIKPFLGGGTVLAWSNVSRAVLKDLPTNEIGGGWFAFALRDSVYLAHYHDNLSEALDYYNQVAKEIETACDKGELQCLDLKRTLVPVIDKEDYPYILHNLYSATKMIFNFQPVSVDSQPSEGTDEQIEIFEAITLGKVAPASGKLKRGGITDYNELKKTAALNLITLAYQKIMPYLITFSVAAFLLKLTSNIKSRNFDIFIVFSLALLAAVLAYSSIVAIFATKSDPSVLYDLTYISTVFPLVILFVSINIYSFFRDNLGWVK